MVASLTGAVSSQRVTEEFEGKLKSVISTVERKGKCLPHCKTDMSSKDFFLYVYTKFLFTKIFVNACLKLSDLMIR